MTIAAGFIVRDGILLCSDSQYTSWDKVYSDKLFVRPFGNAIVSFALAGDGEYGRSAIEDCWESIAAIPHENQAIWNLRKSIRRTLKTALKDCPPDTKPSFLIGISHTSGAALYTSKDSAMPPVQRFGAIGSGAGIAEFIMKSFQPIQLDTMTIEGAAMLALRLVAAAKRNDPFVGGGTQFLAIRGMGAFQFGASASEGCDQSIDEFDQYAENLLSWIGDARLSTDEFLRRLDIFTKEVNALRHTLVSPGSRYQMLMSSLSQAGSISRQWTKDEEQSPLPSQG